METFYVFNINITFTYIHTGHFLLWSQWLVQLFALVQLWTELWYDAVVGG